MLGRALDTYTKSSIENTDDYFDFLYGNIKGYVTKSKIIKGDYHQYYLGTESNITAKNEVDVYTSMNSFYRKQRSVSALKRLNTLYVDIDCYKAGYTKEAVLFYLEDLYNTVIPYPSMIVDSGRGLYLIWKLRDEDRNAIKKWSALQHHFCNVLKDFGSDSACTDGARILRVPFSINSKSNSAVEVISFTNISYTLYELTQEYIEPITPVKKKNNRTGVAFTTGATAKQISFAKFISEKQEIELPNFNSQEETAKWIETNKTASTGISSKKTLKAFCDDLKTLYSLRKTGDCKREIALFMYRYWNEEIYGNSEQALEDTLAFNDTLTHPFSEKYVRRATKSATNRHKRGAKYNYKIETIISLLEITVDEMSFLKILKNRKEKKKDYNKTSYLNKLANEGKSTKEKAIHKRQANITALLEQGFKAVEIQKELGISKATYHRDILVIGTVKTIEAIKDVVEKATEKVEEVIETVVFTTIPKCKKIIFKIVSFFKYSIYKRNTKYFRMGHSHYFRANVDSG